MNGFESSQVIRNFKSASPFLTAHQMSNTISNSWFDLSCSDRLTRANLREFRTSAPFSMMELSIALHPSSSIENLNNPASSTRLTYCMTRWKATLLGDGTPDESVLQVAFWFLPLKY